MNPCLNSLTHGAAAESLFIPGENPADFEALLDRAFAEHQPSSDLHSSFVYDSVHARWMLARRQRTTAAYELELHKQMPDPLYWSNDNLNRLNLFDRYKTQAERALRRAFVNLQAVQKDIFNEQLWREKLAIQKERLTLEREKFAARGAAHQKPAPEAAETLEQHIRHEPALNCHVIFQRTVIRVDDAVTSIIELAPANAVVRQLIANRAQFANEPKLVVRYCTILKDSRGIMTSEHRQMSFAKFHALAEQEDIQLARRFLSEEDHQEEDDETLDDED